MNLSLLHVNLNSRVLRRSTRMDVILPDAICEMRSVPVLFLLHGMTDDHTIWQRRTSIERYADEKGIAVVMPETGLGWYTNAFMGENYFDYISDEVVRCVRLMFPKISQRRENTFVAGHSMGGYGALKCALKRPDTFSKVAALSGALDISGLMTLKEPLADAHYWHDLFGDPALIPGSANDLFHAAETLKSGRPEVFMWCGTEDFLYDMNIRMRDHLQKLGYDLSYSESPGDHRWKYWDREIQNVLSWLLPDVGVIQCR